MTPQMINLKLDGGFKLFVIKMTDGTLHFHVRGPRGGVQVFDLGLDASRDLIAWLSSKNAAGEAVPETIGEK